MGRLTVGAAAADEGADGVPTEMQTVSVWRQPGEDRGDTGAETPPLWERLLFTPNVRLVRGGGEGEGDRGASAVDGVDVDDTVAASENLRVVTSADASAFDVGAYFASLRTRRDGRTVFTARELPSTQNLMQAEAAAATIPPGIVCIADIQRSGRGRGGNQWSSPPGCLMFSLLTTHPEGRTLPFLQYIATMAAVDAIQEAADDALARASPAFRRGSGRAVDVRIKWPNDLYSGGLKIGGVLCNSTYTDGVFNVVTGVGLNLDNAEPTTCINAIIGERLAKDGLPPPPTPLTRERLLATFMNRFEAMCGLLVATGDFGLLEEAYLRQWLHTDQEVMLEEDGGATSVMLTIKGVTGTGYLLAVDNKGARYELHPDGNSLDFFKGLVRKKLP